ncbi:ABC transporter ATP-binding protein, partial [Sinorhizobium meliloti]
ADLRMEMRFEIAKLHADVKTTMIYVTHDQTEAMTLADRIVILNHGQIEQVGRPRELYDRPENRFVAGFLGSPRMNFAPLEATAPAATVLRGAGGFAYAAEYVAAEGRPAEIGLRPEALKLVGAETKGAIRGTFERMEDLGYEYVCYVRLTETLVWTVRSTGSPPQIAPGDPVGLSWQPESLYLFGEDGRRIDHRASVSLALGASS